MYAFQNARKKIAARREPFVMVVPSEGLCDEKGHPVCEINHPAHEFSLPYDVAVVPGGFPIPQCNPVCHQLSRAIPTKTRLKPTRTVL